ncbi:hypothetical protein PR048_009907 [Dryococelus australis]|uniref:Retroviral polymerase SH3-like domain-containing protein n=1 Tax=Dryococelus australis TaxID=614101 RepID=A0ABQ9I190_9NEOP|nr:hypothetical protein PR048_009907 [Dryococelus australis]
MKGYLTNGYRLWNHERRKVKLSRDITFVESTEKGTYKKASNETKYEDNEGNIRNPTHSEKTVHAATQDENKTCKNPNLEHDVSTEKDDDACEGRARRVRKLPAYPGIRSAVLPRSHLWCK